MASKGKVNNMARKTIIHLSDLHIGLRQKETTHTKKLFKKITEDFPGVPILITGDLTDSATKKQFNETRKLLDELAKTNPVLAVPECLLPVKVCILPCRLCYQTHKINIIFRQGLFFA